MVLIQSIIIKSEPYFYEYYNNYINKANNCESDKFIIKLLKCNSKLLNFKFIDENKLLQSLNKDNPYELYIYNSFENKQNKQPNNINNHNTTKNICSICVDNFEHKTVLKCKHMFCYKCINQCNNFHINKNNKYEIEKINNQIQCPICNKKSYYNSISILTNNNIEINNNKSYLNYFVELLNSYMYINKNTKSTNKSTIKSNKEFIYKYIGYKTYYILNLINYNKSPLNISKKGTPHFKIIISYCNKWTNYMNYIMNYSNDSNDINSNILNYTTINFMSYDNFNQNFIINFNKFVNKLINTKCKITCYFIEPRKLELNNILYNNILTIKKNIKNYNKLNTKNNKKIESINFKQFIIKNTIDEKIFKNKVIIYN